MGDAPCKRNPGVVRNSSSLVRKIVKISSLS